MPIVENDIKLRLSKSASPGGSGTQANPNNSLGGYASTTEISSGTLHNLFDVVTGDESAAGMTDYRLIFVHNSHATLTLQNAVVWITQQAAAGVVANLSVDTTAASPYTQSGTAQSKTVANETTAPSSQTFSGPTSKGTGLSIGNLAPGQVRGVWIRRAVSAGATARSSESVSFRVEGDTEA